MTSRWYRLGGWLGLVDLVMHARPLRWVVPVRWQVRVCDAVDRRLLCEVDWPWGHEDL